MIPKAHPLVVHHDARGRLCVLVTEPQSHPHVYFTTLYPGIIKAFHRHKKQTDFMTCVSGMVRIVVTNGENGAYQFISGEQAPVMVEIFPGWWHGIQNLGKREAVIVNCPTEAYNEKEPDEERKPWNDYDLGFDWLKRNG